MAVNTRIKVKLQVHKKKQAVKWSGDRRRKLNYNGTSKDNTDYRLQECCNLDTKNEVIKVTNGSRTHQHDKKKYRHRTYKHNIEAR
jgi:hypothetical protein